MMNKDQKVVPILKLKRSPNRNEDKGNAGSIFHTKNSKKTKDVQMNFTLDMKRLGLSSDIQGVKENQKKLIIKCRHISPPPNLNGDQTEELLNET